jgi:predicted Rossmann-fold nucleotide-binding protein
MHDMKLNMGQLGKHEPMPGILAGVNHYSRSRDIHDRAVETFE